MMTIRLRECLRTLKWGAAELAEASNHDVAEVKTWLDGRARPPLAVAAWLEALVKAHRSVPPLGGPRSSASAIIAAEASAGRPAAATWLGSA